MITCLLVAVLGVIFSFYWSKGGTKEPEKPKKSGESPESREPINLNKETTGQIINKVLPAGYNKKISKYYLDNLNGDNYPEIIITALEENSTFFRSALVIVITVLDEDGNYKKIGELKHQEGYFGTPWVRKLEDIDNDSEKEIFLALEYGGASCSMEGIFDVDFTNQKISWMRIRDERGNIRKAESCSGGALMHNSFYKIDDLDQDGNKEFIEVYGWKPFKKPEKLGPTEGLVSREVSTEEGTTTEWWVYQASAYEWDGSLFAYSESLSKIMIAKLLSENN